MIYIFKELNPIEIGERIKNKLKELNIKQTEVVEKTGLSKTAISNYVLGNRLPDTNSVYLLSNFLNVSIEWLLIGKESINLSNEEFTLLKKYNLLNERNKGKIDNFIDERIAEQESCYTKDIKDLA